MVCESPKRAISCCVLRATRKSVSRSDSALIASIPDTNSPLLRAVKKLQCFSGSSLVRNSRSAFQSIFPDCANAACMHVQSNSKRSFFMVYTFSFGEGDDFSVILRNVLFETSACKQIRQALEPARSLYNTIAASSRPASWASSCRRRPRPSSSCACRRTASSGG